MADAAYVNPRTGGNVSDADLAAQGATWTGMNSTQSGGTTPTGPSPNSSPTANAPGLTGPSTSGSGPTSSTSAPAVANPYPKTGIITGNIGQDTSGNYTAQDQSVESRIPGLLSTDNPIVQTAIGGATQAAAARGLQNSTMNVEAGQKAAEASVLPIALQDAAQTAAQNLSAQGAAQTGATQGQSISGTLANTSLTTGSNEAINAANIKAAADNLNTQISSNQALLTQSLGSQANLQAAQLAANKELQGEQLTAQEQMLADQLKNALSISTNQLSQSSQQQVTTSSGQYAAIYQDAVNQINANKDMPSDARATALATVQAQYSSNMNLLSQLYGIKLTWTVTGTNGGATTYTGNTAGGTPTGVVTAKPNPTTPSFTLP